jgi:peptidoglycan/xylan/chitin deacetylase (PgdA/CDA1 family)
MQAYPIVTRNPSVILTYHSIDDSGSVISISPRMFRQQMEFLAASEIPVLPLDQVLSRSGSVAITFDDGYRNVLDHVIPVLDRLKLPATVFVVSEYCGKQNNWPGQNYGLAPDLPLLNWDELSDLPPGISMGAHTMTHPDLRGLSPQDCERELRGCQESMEQRLRRPVRWLAYPYGASSPQVRALAGSHFDLAVGASLRFASDPLDRLDLPRIDTYYLRGHLPVERLFDASGRLYIQFRNLLREIRRVVR